MFIRRLVTAKPDRAKTEASKSVEGKKIIKLFCIAALMLGSAMQAMNISKEQLGDQLLEAAKQGNYQKVEALLAHGAPVDAKDHWGSTPLMVAAGSNNKKLCELLLAYHAQVNARDGVGYTPLLIAAGNGLKDICELLLAHNAQVDAKNNQGWTPLMLAADFGYKDICQLLLAYNARIDAKDNVGKTAFILAAKNGHKANHKAVCELLIDAMLEPTKEQRDSVVALLAIMKREKRSRDERSLVSQNAFNEIRQQNKPRALAEIAKIENETLRNELIEYVNRK